MGTTTSLSDDHPYHRLTGDAPKELSTPHLARPAVPTRAAAPAYRPQSRRAAGAVPRTAQPRRHCAPPAHTCCTATPRPRAPLRGLRPLTAGAPPPACRLPAPPPPSPRCLRGARIRCCRCPGKAPAAPWAVGGPPPVPQARSRRRLAVRRRGTASAAARRAAQCSARRRRQRRRRCVAAGACAAVLLSS